MAPHQRFDVRKRTYEALIAKELKKTAKAGKCCETGKAPLIAEQPSNEKVEQLERFFVDANDKPLSTVQGVLIADNQNSLCGENDFKDLSRAGAHGKKVFPRSGIVTAAHREQIRVDYQLRTVGAVLFDALSIPGRQASIDALSKEAPAASFVNKSYMHCKALAATSKGVAFVERSLQRGGLPDKLPQEIVSHGNGIITDKSSKFVSKSFIDAMSVHRDWERAHRDWERALKHDIVV